jgi:hypothetical protein
MSTAATDPTPDAHPVPYAPAPWKMKAEVYWLFFAISKLPEGMYDPLELEGEHDKETGQFKGGLGHIMIVRYADTPVGKVFGSLIFLLPFFGRCDCAG